MASVGTVCFIRPGSAKIIILRPAAFAQRTGKARFLFVELWSHTSGAAWKVRPSGPDVWAGFRPAAYAPGEEWVPQAGERKKGGDGKK